MPRWAGRCEKDRWQNSGDRNSLKLDRKPATKLTKIFTCKKRITKKGVDENYCQFNNNQPPS